MLELCVRAARPIHGSILDAFPQHPGVTDMAEIQTLQRFAYRSDLDQCLENAQFSPAIFRCTEA